MDTSVPFPDKAKLAFEQQCHEQRLQLQASLIELAHDAIIVCDETFTIVSWNRGAEHLYGWSAQEAIGNNIHELLQTRFPESRAAHDHFLAAGEQWQGELAHTCKDGAQVIVESSQVVMRDVQHQPTAIMEINRDITKRKQREGENQVQHRQLTSLVDPAAVPIHDGDGQIIGVSSIVQDITERKRVEAQEQFLTEVSKVLISTLDYQETLANIGRLVVPKLADWFTVDLVDAEGKFELIEVAHKDPEQVQWARRLRERYPIDPAAPTGAPRVVHTGESELYAEISDEMLVAACRDEEELAIARQIGYSSLMMVPLLARGRILGVVSFVSTESGKRYDTRDLALAEEVGRWAGMALDNARLYREVQRSRDQLDIILQEIADGIFVYAPDSRLLYANEMAMHMAGYTSMQEMLATPPLGVTNRYELVDEQGQPFPRSQLTHLRVLAGETEAKAVVGFREVETRQPERWSLVISRPVRDESGAVVMVVTITHDITERTLIERRKDEFINMASHELKTPVTSLKGFTYVLKRRLAKQGDAQILHYLTRIDAQLDKLTTLISDLLDISRMQAGKLALRAAPVDLDALIDETVENMQATTLTHHLLIEGRTGAQVFGDKERLGQVFINLLTNAIKYSPQAEKVIIHLLRDGNPERAIVSIQDFGIGIEKTHHKKIFERFYQVTDPEEKTYPGLGIGLYISHEIVVRHHGWMWVESSKGEGATFFVALPLLQPNEQASLP